MRIGHWCIVTILMAVSSHGAAAQSSGAVPPAGWLPGTSALVDTHTRVVQSRVTARSYQISVALPFAYAERGDTYPVLYAVDANAQLGTVVETARYLALAGQIPDVVVVGIGYLEARAYQGLSWESHLFEGENHVSVVPANVSRGLRRVYR